MKSYHLLLIGSLAAVLTIISACKHDGSCTVHCDCSDDSGLSDTTYNINKEVAEISCEGYAETYQTNDCPCTYDWER